MSSCRQDAAYEAGKPVSPINIEEAPFFSRESPSPTFQFQASPSSSASQPHSTSIAAIAKEFQESKLSDILGLIKNKVPVILVTSQRWDYVPRMFEGMYYIYEGCLINAEDDKNGRNFTMRLSYPDRKTPFCIQFTSSEVVSLLPRHGHRSKPEDCSYFHLHGHCAFGLNCHKAHDPRKLCEKVKERLRFGDIKILNENQQHTLHIAMVEDGVEESEMRSHFEPFGPLKSVKIEPGKTLLQGQGWRIGFVTFQYARDAIKAKKVLNEDPKSKFRGLIQFSKQPTKNHSSSPAYPLPSQHLSLPRQSINPRLDKPTEQLYLHRISSNVPITTEDVRLLLSEHSLTSYLDITISPKGDYALVLFDCVQDGMCACHTLLASPHRQWALDFHPVEDRAHLKIRYLRWLTLRRDESAILQLISRYWDAPYDTSHGSKNEREALFEELKAVKNEIQDADDHLNKLVFQAVRQADTQMKREGLTMDIFQLGAAIGPDAVAYAEEKVGSLRDFVDSQRQSPLFNIQDQVSIVPSSETQPYIMRSRSRYFAGVPDLYCFPLDHVDKAQLIPRNLVEAFC